ncbi:MAG: hypothetical protein KIT84_17845 [Labilithrix sp.]|nr:hypothetical protein [Labilithrix sp.]MCW5812897.1 hypothetical protein [Labilithrix sp.]
MNETTGIRETPNVTAVGPGEDVDHLPALALDDAPLLPEPHLFTGDIGADLAILLVQAAQDDKEISEAIRASEEQLQVAAETRQIEAMERKSDGEYAAGMIGGFSTAGAGLLSFGGINKPDTNAFSSSAKSVEGAGKIASTWQSGKASKADIDATHQGHLAARHGRAASDARDDAKASGELMDRITDLYKEYLRTKAETQKAALLRA